MKSFIKIYIFILISIIVFNLSFAQTSTPTKKITDVNQLKLKLEKQPTVNDIRFVQELLRETLNKKDLKITGQIDNQTVQALKEFQKRFNLPTTGKLDKKTIEVILSLLSPLFTQETKGRELRTPAETSAGGSKLPERAETTVGPQEIALLYSPRNNFSLTVLSPKANDTWYVGQTYTIEWEYVAQPMSGRYPQVESESTSSILEAPRHQISNTSSQNYIPQGGGSDQYSVFPTENQTYFYLPIQTLSLDLVSDRGYVTHIAKVPIFKRSYDWTIPEYIQNGNYRIRFSVFPLYLLEKYYDLDIRHYKPTLGNNYFIGGYFDSAYFKIVNKETPKSKRTIILDELPGSPEVSCDLPEMKRGDHRNEVYLLQLILTNKGFYPERLITGYFGRLTEGAVKKFQRFYRLPANGVVSGETLKIIQIMVNKEYEECQEDLNIIPRIDNYYPKRISLKSFMGDMPITSLTLEGSGFTQQNILRFVKKDNQRTFDFIASTGKTPPINDLIGVYDKIYVTALNALNMTSCSITDYDINNPIICLAQVAPSAFFDETSRYKWFKEQFVGKYEIFVINAYNKESNRVEFEIYDDEVGTFENYNFVLYFNDIADTAKNVITEVTITTYCGNTIYNQKRINVNLANRSYEGSIEIPKCSDPAVSFQFPHFLSHFRKIISLNYTDKIYLTNGDTNNDDVINDSDILNITFNFGQDVLKENGIRYDLNLDYKIDDKDLRIVLNNFGKRGDLKPDLMNNVKELKIFSIDPQAILPGDKVIIKGENFKTANRLVIGIKSKSSNSPKTVDGYMENFKVLDDNTIEIASFSNSAGMCYSFNPYEAICLAAMVLSPGDYKLLLLSDDGRKSNEIEIKILSATQNSTTR